MFRVRRGKIATGVVLAVVVLMAVAVGGCLADRGGDKSRTPPPEPPPGDRSKTEVTLFFGDRQGSHVIPESRTVEPGNEPLGKVVVEGLIAGPEDPFLVSVMPRGTRVLSFEVREGLARVDFSREFRDNHPGGTTGEAMTLNALVFSLTELEGIERVQILVEGREGETLGHVVFDEPFTRGPIRTHEVFLDRERHAWLQGLVDAGREQWRLDALQVARRDGRMVGFRLGDEFRLTATEEVEPASGFRPGARRAAVEAVHRGKSYEISLVQPVRAGDRGVWAITGVRDPEAAIRPETGNVVVAEPAPGAMISSPVRIRGQARVFEGTFTIEIEDGHRQLASKLMAVEGGPAWGEFDLSLPFEAPTNDSGAIVFVTYSAKDGTRIEELIVPVKFKPVT